MDELVEMREQMNLLKSKLDKQEIVNDRLLREVTSQRVRRLNRNVWQEGVTCLFVITFGSYSFLQLGCSWWFVGFTIAYMLFCFLATIIPHNWIKQRDINNGDLLTVAKQVRRLKKLYHNWKRFGWPSVIPWLGWFFGEIYFAHAGNTLLTICIIASCAAGALIGGLIGWTRHKKFVSEMDEIIQSLEQ